MSENFDPYYKWLGIPPEQQPPNHYRLLGIEIYESDTDVIAGAADQRMGYVRSFQTGENSQLSQQLLNEVAAARVCLLTPEKKAIYDDVLRQQLEPPPDAEKLVGADYPNLFDGASAAAPSNSPPFSSKQFWLRAGLIASATALLIVALPFVLGQRDKKAASARSKSQPPANSQGTGHFVKPEPKPERRSEAVPKSGRDLKPESPPGTESEPKRERTPEPQPERKPDAKTELPPNPGPAVEPNPVPQPEPTVDPESETKSTPIPTPDANPEPREPPPRLPVPDNSDQQKALATIREVYKEDYKDKPALANKLVKRADELRNDATARFVLLQEATNVATEVFQIESAIQIIDVMASEFGVSGSALKADVLANAGKKRLTPEQKMAIIKADLRIVDEALGENDFNSARRLTRQSGQLTGLPSDVSLRQEIAAKNKEVETLAKAYAESQEAMARLKEQPTDPDANLIMGKYLCFSMGDWEKGLPMLVLGNDDKLKVLAEKDLAGASTSGDQVKLGDAWWDLSGKERADYWYQKALPGLMGLEKDRIAKRVAEALTVPQGAALNSWRQPEGFHGWYHIRVKNSGMCVAIADKIPGRSAFAWPANQDENQLWRVNRLSNGNVNLINKHSGLHLGVQEGSKQLGANVLQWNGATDPMSDRSWKIEAAADGFARITNAVSGLCLCVQDASEKEGTRVTQEARKMSDGQLWLLDPADYLGGAAQQTNSLIGTQDSQASISKWVVIFHSANPRLWNPARRIRRGEESAVPVASVPGDVKYLKMSCKNGHVIISVTKEKLLQRMTGEMIKNDGVGWCGENHFNDAAYHLGVFNNAWMKVERGVIDLGHLGVNVSGWGFGGIVGGAGQGYCWEGKQIAPASFEIAVTGAELTDAERSFLLSPAK